MKKLLFIPRAVADIFQVLLHNRVSFSTRCNVALALVQLKFASLSKKVNDLLVFRLGKWRITCHYSDRIGFLIKELFIEETYRLPKNKKIETIIDIGANIGMSIAYFKSVEPSVYVEAYEPDTHSFAILEKNVSENHWQNVTLFNNAADVENRILYGSVSEERASVNSKFGLDDISGQQMVKSKDIVEILEHKVDLIKIDIEGAEWLLFKKIISHQLLLKANNWFVEFHEVENNKEQYNFIIEQFKINGFNIEKRMDVILFQRESQ